MRDIDHNRAGRLAPAQAEVLRKVKRTGLLVYAGIPMVTVQIGALLIASGLGARHGIVLAILSVVAGLAILGGTVVLVVALWRRKGRLQHEAVISADGYVIWSGSPQTWTPIRPSGQPFSTQAGGPLLPPGRYRFYLYDEQIVGAESPLDGTTYWSLAQNAPPLLGVGRKASLLPPAPLPVAEPAALRAVLGQVLGFTAEDLDHHRRGELSPRQGGGRVVAVEGPLAHGYTMRGRYAVTYWCEVGGRRFEVPLAWLYAVPPGVAYRCYVDERSQRIVSLEPIASRPPT
ncbi:MAG: hypothetical protein ACK4N5_06380 [Myxococcales bacterium]